ncbi:MAG: EAL domain-containing protein [Pseudolabrys sp.]|nr:EAL domain-containing protein [Pseudolabrys sp.]
MHALQNEILEALVMGERFDSIAKLLCERAEELAPGVHCSILAVTRDGLMKPVAAPSLPQQYSDALDNLPIGPLTGSCGTAAYYGEPVEVTDISTDPLWVNYKALALPLGLMACWSSPIKTRDGRVVATFAFYYKTKRGPTELERAIVRTCVHLCAIAIEHDETQMRNYDLAHYDQLTGLPNRRSFDEMMSRRVGVATPSFGLLVIDIDNLKMVNDTMGHVVGDSLIREVARRFKNIVPASSCRLGGDEFGLLIDGCDDHAGLASVAVRILSSMRASFECNGNTIVPQLTIGGVVYDVDGTTADVLRQNADFALYHAKEMSRGSYVPFEQGLRTSISSRMSMIQELDTALGADRVIAHYQPLVHIDTQEIVGLEALARMRRESGDIINAGQFQAALSDSNVAFRLTDRMLKQVAKDIRYWLDDGIPLRHVGINLSTADFFRDDLERRLSEAFEPQGVPLKHLLLEVTESVLMDGQGHKVARDIERLRKKGMLVALDDFGTGYASLTHLLNFPVDIIKIDKSFIDGLLTDRSSQLIVESLIDLARKLGMRIVAEGIESEAQAARLQKFGCATGQGYLFARPDDAEVTTRRLRESARKWAKFEDKRLRLNLS